MSEYWINNKLTKMTKEEAVLKLIDVHAFLCRYSNPHDKWTDAVNIGIEAIKALEQEPTTKNDLGVDCIDRSTIKYYKGYGGEMYASKGEIDKLPSVTPQEPRKGHWIDDTRLGYHVSVCSNCNWRGHGDTCLIYKPKYCPNCGCAMVEPQESDVKNENDNR